MSGESRAWRATSAAVSVRCSFGSGGARPMRRRSDSSLTTRQPDVRSLAQALGRRAVGETDEGRLAAPGADEPVAGRRHEPGEARARHSMQPPDDAKAEAFGAHRNVRIGGP